MISDKIGGLNKIIIVCGHYGSGKTNIAVNLAYAIRKSGKKTVLADLDIVNPYFRAADNREFLEEAGVRCLIPMYANSNVDIPCLPPEIYSVFSGDEYAILDVGGDKEGATALGIYREEILRCGYSMLGVCNMYRPLTLIPEDAIDNLAQIEAHCSIPFTHIVNNSNLADLTTEKTVYDSFEYAETICKKSGLPLLFTSVCDDVPLMSEEGIFRIKNITKRLY